MLKNLKIVDSRNGDSMNYSKRQQSKEKKVEVCENSWKVFLKDFNDK